METTGECVAGDCESEFANPPDIPLEGTLIVGVGDEVVLGGVALVLGLLTVFYLVLCSWRSGEAGRVHPDQTHAVEDTRRDMGIEHPAIDVDPNERCSVCLAPLVYPVQTNCGHTFCAQCVLTYWRHDQWPRAARCPICRRQVTLLLADRTLREEEAGRELWAQVTDYNQRMSGQWRPFMHYLYDVPALLSHMWRELFTVQGLLIIYRLRILFIILLVVVYLILPFDLLPEMVLGVLGFFDDILVVLLALVWVTLIYRAYVANGNH